MKRSSSITYIILYFILIGFNPNVASTQEKRSTQWMQYASIEEAGFSPALIDSVKIQYENSGASSLLVISDGYVALSLGETTRRFMTHSIRKSFMSALIGIEVEKGNMTMNQSLESMEIDDLNSLTSVEKKATLKDLISARSGIYLPSAYAPENMIKNLPERGSASPGEKWYYNNWDFNILATIYNQETGKDFFSEFKKKIADPIGMEDFRLMDTYYRYEKDKSLHPAYLFNMSARDMARFGQLYLNEGMWNGIQIVPKSWVRKSTSMISNDLGSFDHREGYGFLWWVTESAQGKKMYYASGAGGHRIVVIPDEGLVIVVRSNTYENRMVRESMVSDMVQSIIDAKIDQAVKNPSLISYNPPMMTIEKPYTGTMDQYLGTYIHPFFGSMEVAKEEGRYILKNNIGAFRMWPVDKDRFYPEDLQLYVRMVPTNDDQKRRKMEMVFSSDRSLKEVICYY